MNKLTITVTDDDAVEPHGHLPREIVAQYNPAELSLQKGAQLAEQNIPGLDSPLIQFVRGQAEKLTVELTLDQASADDTPGASVAARMNALYQLVKVQPKTHAPPRVKITWGAALTFAGVAESVTRRLTLFDREGAVQRAVVTVAFREYRTLADQLAELNLQSTDQTKVTVLRAGDRLDVLAQREYGDADMWRALARWNRIEDPRHAVPGTRVEIPPREQLR